MVPRLKQLGFDVTESHTNFVWATRTDRPVKPIYEALKSQGILVRYMDYTQSTVGSWGDGLRISVGTDGEIDAMLMVLEGVVG
jgi:histidinol-phosphate aminotransferase